MMREIGRGRRMNGGKRGRETVLIIATIVGLVLLPISAAAFSPSIPATRPPENTSGSFQVIPTRIPSANGPPAQAPVPQFRPFELSPPCTPTNDTPNDPNSKIYTASYYVWVSGNTYTAGQSLAQNFAGTGQTCAVILDFGQAATQDATGPPYVEGVNQRDFVTPTHSQKFTFVPNTGVAALAELFVQGYLSVAQTPASHI
ncbi:MAG: hypothetical protein ACYDAR_06695, partial [Thermomicrobiales bacterium]